MDEQYCKNRRRNNEVEDERNRHIRKEQKKAEKDRQAANDRQAAEELERKQRELAILDERNRKIQDKKEEIVAKDDEMELVMAFMSRNTTTYTNLQPKCIKMRETIIFYD